MLDVEAAVGFLQGLICPPPAADRIALIGASNGTTSALDYTVAAATDPALPSPAALVFMSGGPYTEAQHTMQDSAAVLAPLPMLFLYPSAERAWDEAQASGAPARWRFVEYTPGSHGTGLLSSAPQSLDEITSFLSGALSR